MACKHYYALFGSKWSYSPQKNQKGFFNGQVIVRLGFINFYSEIEKAYNEVAFELMKKYDFHLSSFSRKFEIINAYIVMFYENS